MDNKNVELMMGEPERAIKKLAIPIIISMLLTASYNIIDGVWIVGLGQAAIAGIGFVNPIFIGKGGFCCQSLKSAAALAILHNLKYRFFMRLIFG